jgi:hypothetical protein
MDSNNIPRLDDFVIVFSEMTLTKQFETLKSTINNSLEYYKTAYVSIDQTDVDKTKVLFEDKLKSIMDDGYGFYAKIHTMLSILQITDTSQTHKYKYEESLHILIEMHDFMNSFNSMWAEEFRENIIRLKNTAEILKNDNSVEKQNEIKLLYENGNSYLLKTRINVFNHCINQFIIQLCKIKLILKNICVF